MVGDMRAGLTTTEVEQRRVQFGENRLPEERVASAWNILLSQFKSPLIAIIGVAALISLALGERADFVIITVVVMIDVALGFAQEYKAQQSYLALRNLLKPTATVIRNGIRTDVEVWEIVPDDVVLLAVGDKVPADGVLVEGVRLAVDEALLTGESEPVTKQPNEQLFMGSTVVTGRGLLQVRTTGLHTELGKIAETLTAPDEGLTPLQLRLKTFSHTLTKVVVATTVVLLIVGVLLGQPLLSMLRTAIVLSIAAVPEGLIIAVTVILVVGMRKVLRRQGLVKRLVAVETLGSVTTICTDKTGTLTEGRMRVTDVDFVDSAAAMQVMVLCNDLEGPVDVALWEYAEQHLDKDPQTVVDSAPRLAEELFTSETKYMIAAITSNEIAGERCYLLKGAPEVVLDMCDLPADERARIEAKLDAWADRGLRMIGLADRHGGELDTYTGYRWLGLLGMEDPVREGVLESVAIARKAGIRVLMVTGDYRRTAEHIAERIGIPPEDVYARIRPADKLQIIHDLKAQQQVTAMIGDGVNDAPALKAADIGVVVGSATDVAKETADLILLDNNFRTVVAAIEEGRTIFDNIRKVIAYVLSNSFAEMLTIFAAILFGWPTPLLVSQILWIHLICDGPEDIVLAFEPKEDGIMSQPPRALTASVIDRLGFTLIGTLSGLSAIYGVSVFGYYYLVLDDITRGRSLVFASFAVGSVIYILSFRSLSNPIWRMNPISANKPLIASIALGVTLSVLPFVVTPLGNVLEVVPLHLYEWGIVVGFVATLMLATETVKALQPLVRAGHIHEA